MIDIVQIQGIVQWQIHSEQWYKLNDTNDRYSTSSIVQTCMTVSGNTVLYKLSDIYFLDPSYVDLTAHIKKSKENLSSCLISETTASTHFYSYYVINL